MTKKRKCQPQNYQCGGVCIKGTFDCHVGSLTGQSVSIANKLTSLIKQTKSDSKKPKRIKDFSKLKKLGGGSFGSVYSDGKGNAYKVENAAEFAADEQKVQIRDSVLKAREKASELSKILADKGYAPKVKDIYPLDNDKIVSIFEELEGYEDLESSGIKLDPERFLPIKKIFEENKIKHNDLAPRNIMYNKETDDIKIIDFDFAKQNDSYEQEDFDKDWSQLI